MTQRLALSRMQLTILYLFASAVFPSLSRAQAPVSEIEPAHSWIKFNVKASVNIAGKFDKWDTTLTFTSPDATIDIVVVLNKRPVLSFPASTARQIAHSA